MRGPKKIESYSSAKKFFNFPRPLLLVLAVVAVFTYLITINSTATLGIEISGSQKQIDKLQEQNRELEIQITNLRAISRVESLATELNMVAVDQYSYLSGSASVAVK